MRTNSVSPTSLMEQIKAGRAPLVLDVRSQKEFDNGHVPGAVHLPFWRVGGRWRGLQHVRDNPVVLYCGHGPRAHIAGTALKRRGFTRVVYLEGHMKKWKQMGLPIDA